MRDKIVSAYAQHAHAIIFGNYSKDLIKMQISTIKNQIFEKPLRNPSKRTQVNILRKNFFGYLYKNIWFRVCSNFKVLAKIEGKEAKFFSKIYQGVSLSDGDF